MIDNPIATLDEALIPTDDWRSLAKLILRQPDSLENEKEVAAGVLLNEGEADDLTWGPILALFVCRVYRRRVEAFEQRLTQRVIDASGDSLVDAIAGDDYERADKAAGIAFAFAERERTRADGID